VSDAQLDLFGAVAERLDADAALAAERARQRTEFDRLTGHHPDGAPVIWTAPWDTGGGMKAGDTCPGRRCPNCGQIEANEFHLQNNHGWAVYLPDRWDRTTCSRQELLARHAEIDRERAAREATAS